ncbi:hypothetical protein FB45DRAFT_1082011 [Roridomyces roridus]|uniref:Uncharacterized protein n=1 Tax=Roridomyces roridus TaxID=1738132 RepID=A0AAD7FIZ2_9AGAR|nr:hypothetical protein FB45DRAFT_1082011 [Roridomyces roridus]
MTTMHPIGVRRTVLSKDDNKSLYDNVYSTIQATKATHLSSHEFGETFVRKYDAPIEKFGKFYEKTEAGDADERMLFNIVAEIGSEADGTWLAGYTKNIPSSKLPIAARVPTNAPKKLRTYFKGCVGTLDDIQSKDRQAEMRAGTIYNNVTDWVSRAPSGDNVILLRFAPTYEARNKSRPSAGQQRPLQTKKRTRPQAAKAKSEAETDATMEDVSDSDATDTEAASADGPMAKPIEERQVGDEYHPDILPEHRGSYFAHNNAVVVQRELLDENEKLIAPNEIAQTLTEGTLFIATVSLEFYNFKEDHYPSKTYHVHIDTLKVLDVGDGIPWEYPIPEGSPVAGSSKAVKREGEKVAASAAMSAFQSPSKRARKS